MRLQRTVTVALKVRHAHKTPSLSANLERGSLLLAAVKGRAQAAAKVATSPSSAGRKLAGSEYKSKSGLRCRYSTVMLTDPTYLMKR